MTYSYTAEITYSDANKLVAELVYPGEGESARKRVRTRIRRAQKDGDIPSTDPMEAALFFRWACRVPGWEKLRGVEGLPIAASEQFVTGSISSVIEVSAETTTLPGDQSQLMEKCATLERENRQLKAKLETQELELERLREMERRNRQAAQERGRQVGQRDQHGNPKKNRE